MKLKFTLHGVPDEYKNSSDLYRPGKKPAIRIKQCAIRGNNFEETIGILWFTDADDISLNTKSGWRFYNLKKL